LSEPFVLIFEPLLVRWILSAALTLIPQVLMKWGRSLTDD
jgi:hypothetical protein